MTSIPVADAARFGPIGRRTNLVRGSLAVVAVGAIVASCLFARHPHTRTLVDLPGTSTAIVVLDLSASISSDTYSKIGTTLSSLASSRGRYGLVIFSAQAYEAVPPGSPAADLEPLVRYFRLPPQGRPGFAPQFPQNPWGRSFSSGTKISAGLALAHQIALDERQGRPGVVLVSDLDDDPQDIPRLATVLLAYRRDRVPVEIVGLDAAPENAALFERLLGSGVSVRTDAAAGTGAAPHDRTAFPWALVALALAAAAALAAHELWAPRLEWGRSAA